MFTFHNRRNKRHTYTAKTDLLRIKIINIPKCKRKLIMTNIKER